ncbi:hypothetical protein GCM10023205_27040 [Yinghuangia aomiensis]|uniref:Uncharacterized protein n=1 Tax=Yinghuangia aomiensis TaxID=676205 RepID=A0ABP9H521_9ACTN
MAADSSEPAHDAARQAAQDAATEALITMARRIGVTYRAVTGAVGQGTGHAKYVATELMQPDNAPRVARTQPSASREGQFTGSPRAQRREVARRDKAVRSDVNQWRKRQVARSQDSQDTGGATALAARLDERMREYMAAFDAEAARRNMTPAELRAANDAAAAQAGEDRVTAAERASRPARRRMITRHNAQARPGRPLITVVRDFRGLDYGKVPVFVGGGPQPPRPVRLTGDALAKGLGDGTGGPSKFALDAVGRRTVARASGAQSSAGSHGTLLVPESSGTAGHEATASAKRLDRSGRDWIPPMVMPAQRARGVPTPWTGSVAIHRSSPPVAPKPAVRPELQPGPSDRTTADRMAAGVPYADHDTDRGASPLPHYEVPYQGRDGQARTARVVVDAPATRLPGTPTANTTPFAKDQKQPGGRTAANAAARRNEELGLPSPRNDVPDLPAPKHVPTVAPMAAAPTKGLGKVNAAQRSTAPTVRHQARAGAANPWVGVAVIRQARPRQPSTAVELARDTRLGK